MRFIRLLFVAIIFWMIFTCMGFELEREGRWMWGHIFDFICMFKIFDLITILILVVAATPVVVYLLIMRWMLN